jgi:uncharacterized repeat protein (TIGR01451 family)/fimbrial isopeptide formation D2 family protein
MAVELIALAPTSALAKDWGIQSSPPSGASENDTCKLQYRGSDNILHTVSVSRTDFQGNTQTRDVTYRLIGGSWYPDAIVNGDFQYPSYKDGLSVLESYDTAWVLAVNYTTGSYWTGAAVPSFSMWPFAWRTNATNNANWIELQPDHAQNFAWDYSSYMRNGDGNMFSEISLDPAATGESIYQDVYTVPGAIYCWSVSHACYDNPNQVAGMSVMIGSTESQDAQAATRVGTVSHKSDGTPVYTLGATNGASMSLSTGDTNAVRFTNKIITTPPVSGKQYGFNHDAYPEWEAYQGSYLVPDKQSVTRFRFYTYARSATDYSAESDFDDVTFQITYPLFFNANGGTGAVPLNDDAGNGSVADDEGTYRNYYAAGTTVKLGSYTSGATTAYGDADFYSGDHDDDGTLKAWDSASLVRDGCVLVGWSAEKYDPFDDPAEAAKVILSSYDIKARTKAAPDADGKYNAVYAVWVRTSAALGANDVRLRKTETGVAGTESPATDFTYTITPKSTTAKTSDGTAMATSQMPLPQATPTTTVGTRTVAETQRTTATISDGGTSLAGFAAPVAVKDAAADTAGSPSDGSYEVFGDMAFTQPGDYVYTITEDGSGTIADGWEYNTSRASYTLRVRVEKDDGTDGTSITGKWLTLDEGDGTNLIGEAGATFNNARLAPVSVVPSVTKSVTINSGTPAFPATFEYTITPTGTTAEGLDATTMPASVTAKVTTTTPATLEDQVVAFGAITFTRPGTYTYSIAETYPTEGWSNVSGATTLTVVVEDVNGKLTATVSTPSATVTADGETAPRADIMATAFANAYTAPYVASAHIVLTKSLDDASRAYAVGDTACYTITVANTGDADAENVAVPDAAENLTYVSSTGATRTSSGWSIDKVAAGSSTTIKATYTVDATPFSNYAGIAPKCGNGYRLTKTRVTDAAGATAATGAVEIGQSVYYRITVTPTQCSSVPAGTVITDSYDSGLSFDAVQSSGSVADGSGNTLTWTLDSDVTTATSVVVAFTVNENASGNVVNEATTPTNAVINVTPVGQLDVTKRLVSFDADAKTAVFEITATNTGTDVLTNATFSEDPKGLTFKRFDARDGVSYSGGTFTIASLAAGKSVTITGVTFSVDGTSFENQVVAPQPGPQQADIEKSRVDANGNPATNEVSAGDTVYYKLTLANTGTLTIPAGFLVTDTPSANLSYGGDAVSVTTNSDGSLAWNTTEALKPGQTISVIIPFTVTGDATGQIDNVAHIPGKAVDVVMPLTPARGKLVVTKSVDKSAVSPGDTLTYTITVKNTGNGDLSGILITDYVPVNTTFSSVDKNGTYGSTIAGKEFVNWFLAKLATGESKALTFTVVVNDVPAGTTITNTVPIDTGKTPTDTNDSDVPSNTAVSTVTRTNTPTNSGTTTFSKAGTRLVDTGDWTMLSDLPALFASGTAALLAGWVLRRRRE